MKNPKILRCKDGIIVGGKYFLCKKNVMHLLKCITIFRKKRICITRTNIESRMTLFCPLTAEIEGINSFQTSSTTFLLSGLVVAKCSLQLHSLFKSWLFQETVMISIISLSCKPQQTLTCLFWGSWRTSTSCRTSYSWICCRSPNLRINSECPAWRANG